MRYGYCFGIDFLQGDAKTQVLFEAIAEAGFDYLELQLRQLWDMQPGEMAKLKEALQITPCRACNVFFPGEITLVGPQMDMGKINAYLEKMLPLSADLGAETLVFGNGGARKVPEGGSREAVWHNLRAIVEAMDMYAKKAGITIAVEPLNTGESNIINSYGEAVALTEGLTHVSTMIDSYHTAVDGRNYDDVYKHPEALKHLHTAYPIGRTVPSPEDDMALYADFVKMVKTVGYDGKVSVEGAIRSSAPAEVKAEVKSCLDVLRGMI